MACSLIPLNKNPGVRPIGVGEVLRRIIGKAISWTLKEEFCETAGPLQTCAGHSAGAEAAIHSMKEIFFEQGSDAVLLIDASNAFNCMNRKVAMHNIQITCTKAATYIINTYRHPSRLFISGGGEIESQEGTTQGDPLAMPWYSCNTGILINQLGIQVKEVKQVWLADDSAAGGTITNIFKWFNYLSEEGKKFGYHVNGKKSWLIVKNEEKVNEAETVFGNTVNITSEGKRHLGAVIGSQEYKDEYGGKIVSEWEDELENLVEIAKSQPQAAYIALTKAYKSKFTYFMRTIESFEDYVSPIDELLNNKLLPTLFNEDTPFDEVLTDLFTLPTSQGGLGIPNLKNECKIQYETSKAITKTHVKSITSQSPQMLKATIPTEVLKQKYRVKKETKIKEQKDKINQNLSPDTAKIVEQMRDKGASSWLNAIPFEEHGFVLHKGEFRDALRLRYNLRLQNLPSKCTCDHPFNIDHALICKKGGFVAQRHDNIKNLLTCLLAKVCKDVEVEPILQPLDNEVFSLRSASTTDDARLDIKASGFWERGVTAFFDVRVTHVNSGSFKNKTTTDIFKSQEQEKKRKYGQRVIEVEHGQFTPLVFGTNGGIGGEGEMFLKKLAHILSRKQDESYTNMITWLRTKLSFEILRSVHTCIRGSRAPFKRPTYEQENTLEDCALNIFDVGI